MQYEKIVRYIGLLLIIFLTGCITKSIPENSKYVDIYKKDDKDKFHQTNSNSQNGIEKNLTQVAINYDSIVIGEYIENKVIAKKNFFEEVQRKNDLGAAIGGKIYTFKVKKLICNEKSTTLEEVNDNSLIFFFNAIDSGFYQPYEKDRNYLIYLSPLPEQNKLKDKYNLDSQTIYYSLYSSSEKDKYIHKITEVSSELNDKYFAELEKLCK